MKTNVGRRFEMRIVRQGQSFERDWLVQISIDEQYEDK